MEKEKNYIMMMDYLNLKDIKESIRMEINGKEKDMMKMVI